MHRKIKVTNFQYVFSQTNFQYVCERGFSCMNNKKSLLRTRYSEDTLEHITHMNIDGQSLDNFDTEKLVSDLVESAVTSRHLNGHNSSRTETHEEADEKVMVL